MSTNTLANAPTLAQRARNIRRNALRMGEVQGQGYIAQALDIADVLAVAYFHAMRYRPEDPSLGRSRPVPSFKWSLRHRPLCRADRGRHRPRSRTRDLWLRRKPSSDVWHGLLHARHGNVRRSLGLGLSIAVGMGLGLKQKGSNSRVYTLFSDGELDEGSKWEAMMSAAHHKLDNLIAIIDVNNQQADGPSKQMMGFEPLVDKLEAFGWFVRRVDGNDLDAVVAAFDAASSHPEPQPRVIVADTLMGKGVPFLEQREEPFYPGRGTRMAACTCSTRCREES